MHRILRPFLSAVLLFAVSSAAVHAQELIINPSGETVEAFANSTGNIASFHMYNSTTEPTLYYNFTCSVAGSVTGCSVSPSSVALPMTESVDIEVTYSTGSVGSGTVTVSGEDTQGHWAASAYYDVVVVPSPELSLSTTSLSFVATDPAPQTVTVINIGGGTFSWSTSGNPAWASSSPTTGVPLGSFTVTPNISGLAPGTYNGTITVNAPGAVGAPKVISVTLKVPVVSLETAGPGANWERSFCTTFAAGESAAVECGDLRVAHAASSVRTLGKVHTLHLLYNSRTSLGLQRLAADILLPASRPTPTKVTGTLNVRAVGTTTWTPVAEGAWSGVVPGATRRVAFRYDNSGSPSGAYEYRVDVTSWNGSTATHSDTSEVGRFVLVNRRASPFGAGWWPAGNEQLVFSPGNTTIAWIDGDGSTRLYDAIGSGKWRAGSVDRPDSLTVDGSGRYTRWAPHRVQVRFDALGRQIATVSPAGDSAIFVYDGSAKLVRIDVPRMPNAYTFCYAAPCAPASAFTVSSPGPGGPVRTTTFTLANAGGLQSIVSAKDPDSLSASFGYNGAIMETRTGRGNLRQTFTFEPGGVVSQVLLRNATDFPGDSGITLHRFTGFPELAGMMDSAGQTVAAADPAAIYVQRWGPRNTAGEPGGADEWVRFYPDRYGAPRKIENYQNATTIERGNGAFPGLVTKITAPNGLVTTASHDDHGNLTLSRVHNPYGTGADAITRYSYDRVWDRVSQIALPMGDQRTTTYNGHGLPEGVSDGVETITFSYEGSLLKSVRRSGQLCNGTYGSTGCETFAYDSLGNLEERRTPLGYLTSYINDAIGRTLETREQVDVSGTTRMLRTVTSYDALSRDTMTVTSAIGASEPVVTVRRTLTATGADSLVTRLISPDTAQIGLMVTQTIRDQIGRPWIQIAPDGHADTTFYYASGEIRRFIDRRGIATNFLYDGLGRLRSRRTDAVHFDAEQIGLARSAGPEYPGNPVETYVPQSLTQTYPWARPNGLDIAAAVDTFVYSATAGTLTDANNAAASVQFAYYPNGQLRAEQQTIQPWVAGQGGPHVYRDSIRYDLNGRRIQLRYPSAIAPTFPNTVTYWYSPTGYLSSVTDLGGNTTTYSYNGRGELTRINHPGGSQGFSYFNDGLLRSDSVRIGSPVYRNQRFSYDARGKRTGMRDNAGILRSDSLIYNVLGQLITSVGREPNFTSTTHHTLDGLGNVTRRSGAGAALGWTFYMTGGVTWTNDGLEYNFYRPHTGRLWYTATMNTPDTTGTAPASGGVPAIMNWYDAAGNLTWTGPAVLAMNSTDGLPDPQSERRMYYRADGKLHAIETRAIHRQPVGTGSMYYGFSRSFEEYRYDALGRRVVTKFDQACDTLSEFNLYNAACRLSGIRRTIWDGNQELGEIQVPNAGLENDSYIGQGDLSSGRNLSPYYGAVAYVFDGIVDQPLSVTRLRYSNYTPSSTIQPIATFTFHPLWNIYRQTDAGIVLNPAPTLCNDAVAPGEKVTCVSLVAQLEQWFPYRTVTRWQKAWHGTLLEDKVGAGGLMYRRNRYYDSRSGRFTQEDPIGLAGGLNLYGYANGDPVNLSDPFGACPIPPTNCLDVAFLAWDVADFARDPSWATAAGVGMGLAALVPGIPNINALRRGGRAVVEAGRAGEAAAGIVRNTERIASATRTAAYRVPDGLSGGVLSEVKNVRRLGLTNQIRDFAAHARNEGMIFELVIREDTKLTGPLIEFIRENQIRVRYLQ